MLLLLLSFRRLLLIHQSIAHTSLSKLASLYTRPGTSGLLFCSQRTFSYWIHPRIETVLSWIMRIQPGWKYTSFASLRLVPIVYGSGLMFRSK